MVRDHEKNSRSGGDGNNKAAAMIAREVASRQTRVGVLCLASRMRKDGSLVEDSGVDPADRTWRRPIVVGKGGNCGRRAEEKRPPLKSPDPNIVYRGLKNEMVGVCGGIRLHPTEVRNERVVAMKVIMTKNVQMIF